MIRTIAYKEFLEMVRDGRLQWAAAIVFVLLLTALAVGWSHYQEISAQHELSQKTVRNQWLNQPEQNPPMPSSPRRFCLLSIREWNPMWGLQSGWKPTTRISSRLDRQRMPPPFSASAN